MPPAGPGRDRRLAVLTDPWVRRAALAVALVLGGAVLVATWGEVGPRIGRFGVAALGGALGCVLFGLGATLLAWRRVLRGLGAPLGVRASARVFFPAQLAKYVPGSVWPVLAQVEGGAGVGVPRAAAGLAGVTVMVLNVACGAAVGLVLLAGSFPGSVPLAVLAVAGAAVVLRPAVLPRVLGRGLRLLGRPGPVPRLAGLDLVAAVAWTLLAFLAYGAQVAVLGGVLGLGLPGGLAVATGAFAAAWSLGFLAVLAPAGAGVRDAALVAALLPVLPAADATAVAVVSRLLMTAGDLLWGVAALGVRRAGVRRTGPGES